MDLGDDADPPPGMDLQGLRSLYGALDEQTFQLAGRAFQILDWDRTHRFCGRCGAATRPHPSDRARQCPDCGLLCFPRVAPAVITLIHNGDEFLLARNARFPRGRYSIIAGFVEPGRPWRRLWPARSARRWGWMSRRSPTSRASPGPSRTPSWWGSGRAGPAARSPSTTRRSSTPGGTGARRLPPSLPDAVSISRRLIDAFLAEHP